MDPDLSRIALGRLEIDFSGADFIADAVLEEIAHQSRDCRRCTGRLSFRFGHPAEAGYGAVSIDRLEVGEDVFLVSDRLLPCSLRRDRTNL